MSDFDYQIIVSHTICRYVPPVDMNKLTGRIRPLDVNIGFDNFEILKIDDADFTVEVWKL